MSRRSGPRIERTGPGAGGTGDPSPRDTGDSGEDSEEDIPPSVLLDLDEVNTVEDLPPVIREQLPGGEEGPPSITVDLDEIDEVADLPPRIRREITGEAGPGEDDDDDDTGTSIDDITRAADAERFDRTYLAGKESFNIGGEIISPAPFPLQVLPRMAYTINYNVVYDEERDRWVPQKKSSGLGSVVFTSSHLVPDNGDQLTSTDVSKQPGSQFYVVAGPADLSEFSSPIEFTYEGIPSGGKPGIGTFLDINPSNQRVNVESRSRNVGTDVTVEFAVLEIPIG